MAERVHRDAGQGIEIALALAVEQPRAFAALEGDGLAFISRN